MARRSLKFAIWALLVGVVAQGVWRADPAWGSSGVEQQPSCTRSAGELPRPLDPPGARDPSSPIEHVIVVMEENHSFDNVLGRLSDPKFYGDQIDGLKPGLFNLDSQGEVVEPFHLAQDCVRDMDHKWEGSHVDWNEGLNDRFVWRNDRRGDGYRVMGYYDERDYPLMYFLADRYAVGDRYFASVMTNTMPNRFYLYAGTSFGRINNRLPNFLKGGFKHRTLFEALNQAHVSWTYYLTDFSTVMMFSRMFLRNRHHFRSIRHFAADARSDRLPQVVFIENSTLLGDEHPPFSAQFSQSQMARSLQALVDSPSWSHSAVFITYDEAGGSYDHVSPPLACKPDEIEPVRDQGERARGGFDRYGFRVPFVALSPWVKRHAVSHSVYDHTSILKFIEQQFNVPALSVRDANANSPREMFDFEHPDFSRPRLPQPHVQLSHVLRCLFGRGYRERIPWRSLFDERFEFR